MKAAVITNLLDFRSISERDDAISYLIEVFMQMTHSATFRAIQRVAEGIDLDTLKAMIELRQIWMRRTDWWRLGLRTPKRSLAFTWDTTRLICLIRKDYPPELMIDEEWLTQWLQLSDIDPAYFSFSLYIEEKILSYNAELLDLGLRHWERNDGHFEIGDDFDWYRRVPDRDTTIRDNFRILTPYDDQFGIVIKKNINHSKKLKQQSSASRTHINPDWIHKYKKLKEKDITDVE